MLYSWKFALKANTKIKPRIAAQSAKTSACSVFCMFCSPLCDLCYNCHQKHYSYWLVSNSDKFPNLLYGALWPTTWALFTNASRSFWVSIQLFAQFFPTNCKSFSSKKEKTKTHQESPSNQRRNKGERSNKLLDRTVASHHCVTCHYHTEDYQ